MNMKEWRRWMGEPVPGARAGGMREVMCDVEETAMLARMGEGGRGRMKTSVQPGGRLAVGRDGRSSCKEPEEARRKGHQGQWPWPGPASRSASLRPHRHSSLSAVLRPWVDGQQISCFALCGGCPFLLSGTHDSYLGSTPPGGHLVSGRAFWGGGHGP